MKGTYTLADLRATVEGDMKTLVKAQKVAREFARACWRLRKASGAGDVVIHIDEDLESNDGKTFDKLRLKAYEGHDIYTIDVGTTEDNPFGIYVGWNADIRVYNTETEEVRVIDGETGDLKEAESRPEPHESGGGGKSGDGEHRTYDPQDPPAPDVQESGRITKKYAALLWKAARDEGGYNKETFQEMLKTEAGVNKPQMLHEADFPKIWKFACHMRNWHKQQDDFESELPL